MERLMESRDPHIEVTPWSKTPSKAYDPVEVEIVAILDGQYVMLLLTKRNGFSMAINLTAAGVEHLYKDLGEIRRHFKAVRKEPPCPVPSIAPTAPHP